MKLVVRQLVPEDAEAFFAFRREMLIEAPLAFLSSPAVDRFLSTGAPPPDGVTMVGRWHDASLRRGFTLAQAKDAEAVARWCHQWADLLQFEIIPVLDDEQIARVLDS